MLKIGLLVTAWVIAAIGIAIPYPVILSRFLILPGCMAVLPGIHSDSGIEIFNVGVWILYLALTLCGILAQKKNTFAIFYAALCIVLIANVVIFHFMMFFSPIA